MIRQEEGPEAEPRCKMLATIRAFPWERLNAAGEVDMVGQRHAAYFAGLAETADVQVHGPQQVGLVCTTRGGHSQPAHRSGLVGGKRTGPRSVTRRGSRIFLDRARLLERGARLVGSVAGSARTRFADPPREPSKLPPAWRTTRATTSEQWRWPKRGWFYHRRPTMPEARSCCVCCWPKSPVTRATRVRERRCTRRLRPSPSTCLAHTNTVCERELWPFRVTKRWQVTIMLPRAICSSEAWR